MGGESGGQKALVKYGRVIRRVERRSCAARRVLVDELPDPLGSIVRRLNAASYSTERYESGKSAVQAGVPSLAGIVRQVSA